MIWTWPLGLWHVQVRLKYKAQILDILMSPEGGFRKKVVLRTETHFKEAGLHLQRFYLLRFLLKKRAEPFSQWAREQRSERLMRSLWIWPLLLCHTLLSFVFLQPPVFRVQSESCVIKAWGYEQIHRGGGERQTDCETRNLLYQNYAWAQRIRSFIVSSHGGSEGDSQLLYCR